MSFEDLGCWEAFTFVTFGIWAENPEFDPPDPKFSSGARSAPRRRHMVGVRGQVKAEYCVPMPRHTQTSLSIHLRLPGQLRCCPEWPLSTGDAACRRLLGVLGVLESGGNCSPKIFPGEDFDTFGVWRRQPTTFGPRGTRGREKSVGKRARGKWHDI